MRQARAIKLETDILGANNRVAQQNRAHFLAHGVTALNLVSSPGSGKTTLLCATIEALRARSPALHGFWLKQHHIEGHYGRLPVKPQRAALEERHNAMHLYQPEAPRPGRSRA